ncbi:MAG: hypothetical protein K2J11_12360 [Oscillospiraceae bacterium]|nr:hypothetical protein [Oscillospiraceae bacterium]
MKIKFFMVIALVICLSAALCGCSAEADVTPLVGTWVRQDIEVVYTLNADKTFTRDENFGNCIQESGTFEYDGKSITFNKKLTYDVRLEGDAMYFIMGTMEIKLKKQ